jgi:hypothetical protein
MYDEAGHSACTWMRVAGTFKAPMRGLSACHPALPAQDPASTRGELFSYVWSIKMQIMPCRLEHPTESPNSISTCPHVCVTWCCRGSAHRGRVAPSVEQNVSGGAAHVFLLCARYVRIVVQVPLIVTWGERVCCVMPAGKKRKKHESESVDVVRKVVCPSALRLANEDVVPVQALPRVHGAHVYVCVCVCVCVCVRVCVCACA